MKKRIHFDFGDKTLPAGYAFLGVNNPWENIEEIFSLDYYKYVSDIYFLDNGVFLLLMVKNRQYGISLKANHLAYVGDQ